MTENQPTPVAAELATRPRRHVGCFWIVAVMLGLLMLAVVAIFFTLRGALRGASLEISEETTYITEPLKSDGRQVDYFASWELETYPEAIATDENGYRLIVQHLGTSPDSTPAHFEEVCRKLGLDAGAIEPDCQLEEPRSFLEAYVAGEDFDATLIDKLLGKEVAEVEPAREDGAAEDALDGEEYGGDEYGADYGMEDGHEPQPNPVNVLTSRIDRPWTRDELPMMEDWLDENSPALDIVAEAVRKPVFHIPQARETEDDTLISVLLPDVQHVRSYARALKARAHFRIGTGDIEAAIDDIVTCKRLGRHVGHNAILIEMLVGIAIEAIADSIGIAGSLEHPPTKEQLERFVDQLDDLPPGGDLSKAMRFERYMSLDIVQSMAHGGTSISELDIPDWMPRVGFDWNVVARRVNAHHDTLLEDGPLPRPASSPTVVLSTEERSKFMADILANLLLPAFGAASEATRRRQCVERMHRVSLAMLRYESDHGTLPPAHTVDGGGKPLHSWRVLLLPYLGQQALYDKIRLDEPWDSDHNRKFHGEAVAFYQCPSAVLASGQTTYSVPIGPDLPFERAVGKRLADFGPKSASMILVVECTQPVCWMDPKQDVPQSIAEMGINVNDGQGGEIASHHPGGANCSLRNGSCRFLAATIDSEDFQGLLRGTVEEVP